jgi:maltooligosyltrehalose trehalohydrolase
MTMPDIETTLHDLQVLFEPRPAHPPALDPATLPAFGAIVQPDGSTWFRLWAPAHAHVQLEIDGHDPVEMKALPSGWFSAEAPMAEGTRYRFRIDHEGALLAVPDPASRAQAEDVHGWSVVVDPSRYAWQVPQWRGRPWHEAVVYELHAGLLGGFRGVEAQLPRLAQLGFTAIELMPVADFPGPRNWGYDGVLPFAPDAAYGTPDDLRRLVDAAHGLGLMVLLDVVYNHFGPDGNYLGLLAPPFFRDDIHTPWGSAIDFHCPEVRAFFTVNAIHWINEYRLDGLRLDAVHAITDADWLDEMALAVRAAAGPGRHVHLVLENDDNTASHLEPEPPRFDAQWNDDAHHTLHVLLSGEREGYYRDYAQHPAQRLARALAEGFVYQGEPSPHRGVPRGTPSAHLPPTAFVHCLQNHDQIGNRAFGDRLTVLAHAQALQAATALLLLAPQIPLVFMGEETGSHTPFLYFTSHHDELAVRVREGRRNEFASFITFADPARRERIPDPNAPDTFEASRPQPGPGADEWLALYRQLLALRREQLMPRLQGTRSLGARALGDHAVAAQWQLGDGTRLVIASNLGPVAVVWAEGPVRAQPLHAGPGPAAPPREVPARSTLVFMLSEADLALEAQAREELARDQAARAGHARAGDARRGARTGAVAARRRGASRRGGTTARPGGNTGNRGRRA